MVKYFNNFLSFNHFLILPVIAPTFFCCKGKFFFERIEIIFVIKINKLLKTTVNIDNIHEVKNIAVKYPNIKNNDKITCGKLCDINCLVASTSLVYLLIISPCLLLSKYDNGKSSI